MMVVANAVFQRQVEMEERSAAKEKPAGLRRRALINSLAV
jgi:hypothetical protein